MSEPTYNVAKDALRLALKAWEGSDSYTFWTSESRKRSYYDVCCGLNRSGEYSVVVVGVPFHTANAIVAAFNAIQAYEVKS